MATRGRKGSESMAPAKSRRIGVLTGGGDAPGLNAVIRAVVKTGHGLGYEILGFQSAFEGLLEEPQYRLLTPADVRGLLPRGGTILYTTNRGRFDRKNEAQFASVCSEAVENMRRLHLAGLVVIGGEGTQLIALACARLGAPIIGVPKTIDNDLPGTDRTFGFDTALQVATDAIDRLHTTAESHNRVMVLEVMGRHAGWIALHAGIAGGADVILIPEIPFDPERIAAWIQKRVQAGAHFSIVVAAEGAFERGGQPIFLKPGRLGGIGHHVSEQIERITGKECRCVVLGHVQRGGSPTPYDRILATRFGAAAVNAIDQGLRGQMVALHAQEIITVPLEVVCTAPKTVPPESDLVRAARGVGVCFGD
jgi:6-phosphofructokinase 1